MVFFLLLLLLFVLCSTSCTNLIIIIIINNNNNNNKSLFVEMSRITTKSETSCKMLLMIFGLLPLSAAN